MTIPVSVDRTRTSSTAGMSALEIVSNDGDSEEVDLDVSNFPRIMQWSLPLSPSPSRRHTNKDGPTIRQRQDQVEQEMYLLSDQNVSLIDDSTVRQINDNQAIIDRLESENKVCAKEEEYSDYKLYYHFLLTFGPIGASVTLFWRGMWTVLDMYLYPNNIIKSGWVSLALGLSSGMVCHCISQLDLKKQWSRGTSTLSFVVYGIVERCFSVLVAFGAVTYWRGVWILWDQLVLVDNPVMQNWASLIVGVSILLLLRSFRCTFAPPMVYMPDDADHLDGLTLELCDDLWWEPSAALHFRRKLTKRHFNWVANLIEWKRKQMLSGKKPYPTIH